MQLLSSFSRTRTHIRLHVSPPAPCTRKLEAGEFVISQHALQHFIFAREKNRTKWSYLWQSWEWTQKKRSSLHPFRFEPYSTRSSAGLPGPVCCLSYLRAPVPTLAQISAGKANDQLIYFSLSSSPPHILLSFSTKLCWFAVKDCVVTLN